MPAFFGSIALAASLLAACLFPTRSTYERSILPSTASDIFEIHSSHPPLHQLRAKIDQIEFNEFTNRLGLRPVNFTDRLPNWILHGKTSAWNSVGALPPSHVARKRGKVCSLAKYEGGYLYYQDEN